MECYLPLCYFLFYVDLKIIAFQGIEREKLC